MDHGLGWESVGKMANFWQNPRKVGICWISKRQFKFRWRAEQFTAKAGWDCDGNGLRFARVLGARGRHQPPAPWHISISDPTVSPTPPGPGVELSPCRMNLFPIHSWQIVPWLTPISSRAAVPLLQNLFFFYFIFPHLQGKSLGKITPPFISFCSSWQHEFVSSLLFGQLVAPVAPGEPEPSSAGDGSGSAHITPVAPDFSWNRPSLTFAFSTVTSHTGSCASR